jgi:outer membrane biosynthesis protein TonB
MSYFSKHRKGFIGTIIVHGIILIMLLLFGFFTPLPLPGEEGILVNLGNENFGQGREEPAPKKATPPVQKKEKKVEPQTSPPQKTKATEPVKAKQEVITQDLEKTAAIESAKKKKNEEKKTGRDSPDRKRKGRTTPPGRS